jgi:hypothetical protein
LLSSVISSRYLKLKEMKTTIIIVLLILPMLAAGQDRLFPYTYQSTVLNRGQREIEVWNTLRAGRKNYYSRLDHRTEFETGIGNRLQTAFYLNLSSITAFEDGPTGQVKGTENEISFSNEFKLKLLDPVADPLGIALYAEYGIGSSEYETEGKLIVDKKSGNFTFAGNAVYETEMKPVPGNAETNWEKEHKAELYLAGAWTPKPGLAFTLEGAWRNVIENGETEHSSLFAGPGVSFSMDRFWLNLGFLPQIASLKSSLVDPLDLDEFEKFQVRLLFSYEL